MDYACIVYSSARKSRLKILDSIHCTGLRLALGAFRTSPLLSLCCEAGIPPLKYRRQQFIVSYGATVKTQPTHPNYQILFDEDDYLPYQRRRTITRPTGVRLHELMNSLEESFPLTYNIGQCEIPPWKLLSPVIILKSTPLKKDDSNKQELISNFYATVNTFQGYQKIYTDGSKLEQGTGSAISIGNNTYSWSLSKLASIHTAELYAIWQALRYSEMSDANNTLICTDSLSALQELSHIFSTDPLVQNILALIHWLSSIGKRTVLVWTPSHVGIYGNELADRAAKQAANNNTVDDIPVRTDDIKYYLKSRVLDLWQIEWNNTNSKLKEIKPKVGKWKTAISLERREECIVTRLRIGHTNLTNIYLLTGENHPRCQICNVNLTVKHILLECPSYDNYRRMLQIPPQLHMCLGESSNLKKMINFLKCANLFKKI